MRVPTIRSMSESHALILCHTGRRFMTVGQSRPIGELHATLVSFTKSIVTQSF